MTPAEKDFRDRLAKTRQQMIDTAWEAARDEAAFYKRPYTEPWPDEKEAMGRAAWHEHRLWVADFIREELRLESAR